MRIFMLCLLAVGALVVGEARTGPANPKWAYPGLTSRGTLAKRSSLTAVDDINVNIEDEFGQGKLVRYTQPGYQHASSASGLLSAYTFDPTARRTGSLPPESQHRPPHPSLTGDSLAEQIFLRQLGRSFEQPANSQEQQVRQGVQGLSSELADAPLPLPDQAPFALSVQAPRFPDAKVAPTVEYPRPNPEFARLTNVRRVNVGRAVSPQQPPEVDRPASVPVPILVRQPLDYASSYEESFGPDQNVVIDDGEVQSFEEQAVAFRLTQPTRLQQADVADRQQDFSGLYRPFPTVEDVVTHGQPDEELAVAISRVSDTQHSGYQYSAPAQTFNF